VAATSVGENRLPKGWEFYLERWSRGGLIDSATAARIRTLEEEQRGARGLRLPVMLASGLGGLTVGAGVLLFVAAHWDMLSPAQRFGLVIALVAIFHIAVAFTAERFPPTSSAFDAVGTLCLGAGIFLAGQIFHIQEHWPGGVLLWAIGSCYMVDFFCREAGLVVEVDPGPVRRDGVVRPDAERANYLKQHGLRVLWLSREDVMTGFDSVLEQILICCNRHKRSTGASS
jgi:hypothetical protein